MSANKIRTLVVDDSKFIRTLFTGLLNQTDDIEVVECSEDPYDAREKIQELNPDIITLDMEMPKMDGISFLEKIMAQKPMPVIMVSSLSKEGADITLRALEMGAIDYLAKPSDFNIYKNLGALKEDLANKIRSAAAANLKAISNKPDKKIINFVSTNNTVKKVIAIGASTGGVEAIKQIVTRLPFNSPPTLITQHMPESFTEVFAKRLNTLTQVEVQEARDGQRLQCGHVYIAPGNQHMTLVKDGKHRRIKLSDAPASGPKSSINAMFKSIATTFGDNAIGVILTGMGTDGADGMSMMKKHGAYNIAQSKNSCIVHSMPEAAKKLKATDTELPLGSITAEIIKHCS